MAAAHEFKDVEKGEVLVVNFKQNFYLIGSYQGIDGSQLLLNVTGGGGRGYDNLQRRELASVVSWSRARDMSFSRPIYRMSDLSDLDEK